MRRQIELGRHEAAIFSPIGAQHGPLRQYIAPPFIGTVHDRGVTSSRWWETSRFLEIA